MRVRLVRIRRRPIAPMWVIGALAAFAALACLAPRVASRLGVSPVTCTLRRCTGIPCAACGTTRLLGALGRGDVLEALQLNPLILLLLAILAAVILLRIVGGRTVRLQLSRREKWLAGGLLGVAILANWAYVIVCVG